jgi:hydroxymethylglutaryl-CoA lyase
MRITMASSEHSGGSSGSASPSQTDRAESARVRITDVAARDGLQNEPGLIPTADKIRLVELLALSGVDEVELTGFVSPKWVPQLGDAADVCAGAAPRKPAGMVFSALVPNEKGLESALDANRYSVASNFGRVIDVVSVFTAASEAFSKRNTNATIAETIERFRPVVARAHATGLTVRGYISCVIACPFQGLVAPGEVAKVAKQLLEIGVDEIDLGDTIGAATPQSTLDLLDALGPLADPGRTVLHLHDTFGRASECALAALDWGLRAFDGSAAGLGGCPYASTPGNRAPGNIATETLVRTVHAAGYVTGVDLARLGEAADFARSIVQRAALGASETAPSETGGRA